MPKERDTEMRLPSLDELFSSQEERDDAKLKRIYEIPLSEIDPFPDHPFHVRDDEDMMNLVESVKANGVITPATVRQKEDGRYELLSGHRRMRACQLAELDTLRCEIVDMTLDEATIFMVESNFQRTTILPSEKAFAYKMRMEAMKRLPGRPEKVPQWGPISEKDPETSWQRKAEIANHKFKDIFVSPSLFRNSLRWSMRGGSPSGRRWNCRIFLKICSMIWWRALRWSSVRRPMPRLSGCGRCSRRIN